MKRILIFISVIGLSTILSCDFGMDDECDDDQNGKINEDCVRVINRSSDYKSDGSTFETIKLSFVKGTGTSDLIIRDEDSLLEEGSYLTAVYSFSGKSTQATLVVEIDKVDRTDGRKIWGSFVFQGTGEANFQSYDVERTGSFEAVDF